MLKEYPTSEAVLTAGESRLAESVIEFCLDDPVNGHGEKQKK
jgi:transposase